MRRAVDPRAERFVILTKDEQENIEENGVRIEVMPVYRFLREMAHDPSGRETAVTFSRKLDLKISLKLICITHTRGKPHILKTLWARAP